VVSVAASPVKQSEKDPILVESPETTEVKSSKASLGLTAVGTIAVAALAIGAFLFIRHK